MALALFDRVQETTTTTGTGSVTLAGAVPGFQSFAVVGNGNTCYYTIVDVSAWEVGIGTYSTSGPTLARTTILSNSNGNTSPITLVAGVKSVFLTYPAEKSVNLDASDNVSPLGTVSSGVWQGSTVGVAYGGTGVTASSGANSVVLRDSNQNIAVNRVNQSNTNTTAAGGTTALTAASSYIHTLVGTGGQTYTLPDATTLTTGVAFVFNNLATGTLTVANYAGTTVGTVPSGGAAAVFLTLNSTTGGTWDLHAYLPEGVTFGTNAFNLGTSIVSGGTWQGGTIQTGYGGTGLTSYTSGGAVYANSSSTLTSGTLPVTAGGTGNTSGQAASTAFSATFNSGGAGDASGTTFNGSAARTISYNTVGAPSTTGTNASGTWGISISGNAATVSSITGNTALITNRLTPTANIDGLTTTNFRSTLFDTSANGPAIAAGRWNTTPSVLSGLGPYGTMMAWGASDTQGFLAIDYSGANARIGGGNGNLINWTAILLHSSNYNSYAPTLTGGGASGTWGINVTGSAGSASTATTATNLSGGTVAATTGSFSGTLTVTATMGDGNAPFRILPSSSSGSFQWASTAISASLGGGQTMLHLIGNALSTGNSGYLGYRYVSAANGGNFVSLGFYGNDNLLRVYHNVYTEASGSMRSPIFYDLDNTAFYVDPGAVGPSAALASAIYVGAQSADGVLWDYGSGGTYRPGMQIRGSYPHIDMVGVVANPDHGPTFRFMGYDNGSSGAYKHWVIGTAAQNLTFLDFGFANSNSNPHAGISGYEGVTLMRLTTSGNVGIGGDWGTYGTNGNPSFPLHVIGTGFATSDFRAPIFYDSNDTSFYVDPANGGFNLRGGTSNRVTYITNDSGIRIVNAEGNGVSDTRLGAAYGLPGVYVSTSLYLQSEANVVFRINNSEKGYIDASSNLFAYGSMRSPIFYDSNDTTYFTDPNNISSLYGIAVRGDQNSTDSRNQIFFWGSGDTTTSAIGFKASGGEFPNPTGNGDGYNTYFTMDSDGRGWVFRRGVGGSDFSAAYTSGWITNNGIWQANASMRAPIFYDSNNTAYYVDPASTSNILKLYVGGATVSSGYNGVYATNMVGAASGNKLIYLYNDGSTIKLDSYDYGVGGALNINIGGNGGYTTIDTSTRSPLFYDSNNTAYYLDAASGSRINAITFDRLSSTAYDTPNQLVSANDTNWTFGCFNSGSTYFMQVKFYGTNDDTRGFRVFDTATSIVVWRVNGAGNSIASGNVTAYSDERLKTNWQSMPENYVSRLAQIKVGIYDRIDGSKLTQVGVGAQSLQTLLPQAVDKSDDEMGTLSVNYGSAALASAVELAKYVTALEQRISQLEARL